MGTFAVFLSWSSLMCMTVCDNQNIRDYTSGFFLLPNYMRLLSLENIELQLMSENPQSTNLSHGSDFPEICPKTVHLLFPWSLVFPGRRHTPSSKAVLAFSDIESGPIHYVCRTGRIVSFWNLHGGLLLWLEMEKGPHASPFGKGKAKSSSKSLFCDVSFWFFILSN